MGADSRQLKVIKVIRFGTPLIDHLDRIGVWLHSQWRGELQGCMVTTLQRAGGIECVGRPHEGSLARVPRKSSTNRNKGSERKSFWISEFGFWIEEARFIADCGLRIADCGLRIGDLVMGGELFKWRGRSFAPPGLGSVLVRPPRARARGFIPSPRPGLEKRGWCGRRGRIGRCGRNGLGGRVGRNELD